MTPLPLRIQFTFGFHYFIHDSDVFFVLLDGHELWNSGYVIVFYFRGGVRWLRVVSADDSFALANSTYDSIMLDKG